MHAVIILMIFSCSFVSNWKEYIEDIQMFLLNISFILGGKATKKKPQIFYFTSEVENISIS